MTPIFILHYVAEEH